MRRLVASLTLGFVVLATGASAQQNQPIYPAYDGFLQNPDGSYTLSFAYFSNNADVVTIAPGAANTFAPTPGNSQSRARSFRALAISMRDGRAGELRRQDGWTLTTAA
jgi:hypothetical protein